MAGVASNEPYQRVSRDNGVFDGMLIGMAVAAGGASAGVFGARMHYNGIGQRVERDRARLESQLEAQKQKAQRLEDKFNRVSQNAGPRFYERPFFNKGEQAEADIVRRANRHKNVVEQNRQADLQNLFQTTSDSINRTAEEEAHRQTQQRRQFGYPNPKVVSDDVMNTDVINGQRDTYMEHRDNINRYYDQQISQIDQRMMDELSNNKHVQRRNKIQQNIDNRVNKVYNKYTKAVHDAVDTARQLNEIGQPGYVDKLRSKHIYGRHMGGWKNAAIIGASAVIGGGLGMLTDAVID